MALVQDLTSASPPPTSAQLVTANCSKCGALFGVLKNAWVAVTNSYYLQKEGDCRIEEIKRVGPGRPPGVTGSALTDCTIQTLGCKRVGGCQTVGFECLTAPEHKSGYRHRQFFKISRLILKLVPSKEVVTPNIEVPLASHTIITSVDPNINPDSAPKGVVPSSSANADMDSITDADRVAVKGLNDGSLTWRDAHEEWERRTQRALSPGAFGKRIVGFKGGLNPKPSAPRIPRQPPISKDLRNESAPVHREVQMMLDRRPSTPRIPQPPFIMNGASNQPADYHREVHMMMNPHLHESWMNHPGDIQQQPSDIHGDIRRVEQAVARLETLVNSFGTTIDNMRKEMQSRTRDMNPDDASVIDMLAETVSNVSAKTGEIDGIKVQMESLKRRTKRLEDGSGSNSTLAHPPPSQPPHGYQSPFPTLGTNSQQGTWNPVNTLKRPSNHQTPDAPDHSTKRPRIPSNEVISLDTPHKQSPQQVSHTSFPNGHTPQDNWPSSQQTQRLIPTRGGIHALTPVRRGPGRPRKNPLPELGPPAWEQENWTSTPDQIGPDGYYRALAPGATLNDTPERGRIVRRGSLVPFASSPGLNLVQTRTRQKPVRNSEGILIRKDGKPDQRSVSSAQNLKRFYAKRHGEDGGSSPGAGQGEGEYVFVVTPEREGGVHEGVMRQSSLSSPVPLPMDGGVDAVAVFPNGVAGAGTTRLDEAAAELFEPRGVRERVEVGLAERGDLLVKEEEVDGGVVRGLDGAGEGGLMRGVAEESSMAGVLQDASMGGAGEEGCVGGAVDDGVGGAFGGDAAGDGSGVQALVGAGHEGVPAEA